jgi:hypothetical protein
MSTTSQLYEKVNPNLLNPEGLYSVVIMDGHSGEQRMLETPVHLKNPFEFDYTRLLPNGKHMDLERFYTVANDVVQEAQLREGIVSTEIIKVVQEYQPENFYVMGDEVISVKCKERKPALMNRKGTGRPQRGFGHGHDLKVSAHPNKVIEVESRPIDHKIEFAVWGKTATLANKRALWLERLFVSHSWAFAVQGVERFFWETRGPDTLWKHGEQRLHQRPLTFMVRLREFRVVAHSVLRNVNFSVQISDD